MPDTTKYQCHYFLQTFLPIPFSYSYRNLLARRLTTFLTTVGMALVVFVFAAVLMLAEGLRQPLSTGSYDQESMDFQRAISIT